MFTLCRIFQVMTISIKFNMIPILRIQRMYLSRNINSKFFIILYICIHLNTHNNILFQENILSLLDYIYQERRRNGICVQDRGKTIYA